MAVGATDLLGAQPAFRRRALDRTVTVVMGLAAATALVVLLFIVYYLVQKGASIISLSFLTSKVALNARATDGGVGPAIVGTLVMTGGAALLAIPLGVLGAVYLNEFARTTFTAKAIRFLADVMTGVPSIVMGLFIYTVWVIRFHKVSGLAGSLALACLMLPIVLRTTEEMLKLVPDDLRRASQALGARTWRTTLTVVLPAALSGIISGAMLAIARAAGETAPLIFVAGITAKNNWKLSGPNTSLSLQIFRNASQPFPQAIQRAWGAALTLVAIVFIFTVLARIVSRRFSTSLR